MIIIKNILLYLRNSVMFRSIAFGNNVYFLGRGRMSLHLEDPRAKKLKKLSGVTRFRNSWLWRQAVITYQPDLVLDIGANYGEVAFCSSYPDSTQIILIEANETLASILKNSIQTRTDQARWNVINAGASDNTGASRLYIDPDSSGSSYIISHQSRCDEEMIESIDLVRVDDICQHYRPGHLLFKIDVEGAEHEVLNGMLLTLQRAKSFVGIVELHEKNLSRFGVKISDFWKFVQNHARVALFDNNDRIIDVTGYDWGEIEEMSRKLNLRITTGSDLIMFKSINDIGNLSPPRILYLLQTVLKKITG